MTGDRSILQENIAGSTVLERMTQMTDYLMRERYSEEYGLLYGAMTATGETYSLAMTSDAT